MKPMNKYLLGIALSWPSRRPMPRSCPSRSSFDPDASVIAPGDPISFDVIMNLGSNITSGGALDIQLDSGIFAIPTVGYFEFNPAFHHDACCSTGRQIRTRSTPSRRAVAGNDRVLRFLRLRLHRLERDRYAVRQRQAVCTARAPRIVFADEECPGRRFRWLDRPPGSSRSASASAAPYRCLLPRGCLPPASQCWGFSGCGASWARYKPRPPAASLRLSNLLNWLRSGERSQFRDPVGLR